MCLPASSTFTSFLLLISLQLISKADAVFTDAPLDDGIAACRRLPHSNYLSAEQLMHACQHRAQWIRDRDKVDGRLDPTDSQRAYLDWLQSTREVRQPLTEGKKAKKKKLAHGNRQQKTKGIQERRRRQQQEVKLPAAEEKRTGRKKFVRKEYRMLSDLERKDVQKALNALKERRIDNITIWDLHILVHYPNSAPAAHWGPAFLPWHREFLRQFEAALHNEVPELVGLPYWDSTLDHGLPDPADSVLWSEPLMGNGNGFVRNGPFKDWDTNVLMPLSPVPIKRLFRSTGGRSQDRLMSAQDAEWIASRRNFSELSFCQDKTFESMHGLSHVWVGGFMFVIRVSPNDPTFYLHHAFIDHLWEQFRHRNQDRKQRESEYAKKICNRLHAFDAQMKPFNLRNKDGLSNDYTDFWFEYEPVRHCSPGWPFCDSKFLFCDKTAWRCRSRIQLGGNCTGFAGTEICFESMCIQNICRLPATEGNGFPRREVDLPLGLFELLLPKQRQQGGVVWAKALMLGDESVPLASGIAHVMVRDERTGENTTAFLERGPAEYPETKGLLYLPLPNPKDPDADFNVSLEASDHYGRYCQPYCLNSTTEKFQVCEPKLVLRSQLGGAASNISFTHQLSARKFLDMDLSVHPSRWKLESPFLVFSCQRKLLNSALAKDVTAQLLPPALSAAGQKPAEEISAQPQPHVWFRVGLLKRAGSGRDLDQLQIETEDVQNPNEVFVSSVPRARSSFDQSVLFVRARNPLLLPAMAVTVRVSVRQAGMRIGCEVRCNLADEASQEPAEECQSRVRLHADPRLSQEQVFSPEVAYLPFLGWRMVGHPSEWRLRMPYLALYC